MQAPVEPQATTFQPEVTNDQREKQDVAEVDETEIPQPKQPEAASDPEEITQGSKTIKLKGRRRTKGAGIRISEAHLAVEEDTINSDDLPKDGFTEEQMQRIWNDRVNLLFQSKPSILSSLTKHPPKLKEDHTIELELDGAHQVEQLQETRSVLVDAIRKELNNYSIQLETPVKEVVTKKKAFTPKEIYHQLAEENPHLETLRKQLGLDLDL